MSGVKRLAYVELEVSDLARWQVFGGKVLGCEVVDDNQADSVRLRIDDRPWRIHLSQGSLDDLKVVGLEVDHEAELREIEERLTKASWPFAAATPEQCDARGVREMICFADPSGLSVELSYGSLMRPQSPCKTAVAHGGFFTGDEGLGHLMMVAKNYREVHRFYCDLLGFVTSDYVKTPDYGGQRGDFTFMRCNGRHHTLAVGYLPTIPRRLGHLMLQVNNFDDVGHCLDRVLQHGFRQTRNLGRHINDRMFSFYVESPSGVQIEYGWGGLDVPMDQLEVKTYDVTSLWGHQHLKA